jgi:hypothetical protein
MTFYQLIQEVSQLFPDVKHTQIKLDLNKKYLEFAHQSRIVKDEYNETLSTTTAQYALASDVDEVYDIGFYDANGDPVDAIYTLKWNIDNKSIQFYDYYKDYIDAIENITTLTYYYYKIPDELVEDTDEPDFPSNFHDAIVWGVLEEYFAKFPSLEKIGQDGSVTKIRDFTSAQYWGMKYKAMILDGKRYSNRQGK